MIRKEFVNFTIDKHFQKVFIDINNIAIIYSDEYKITTSKGNTTEKISKDDINFHKLINLEKLKPTHYIESDGFIKINNFIIHIDAIDLFYQISDYRTDYRNYIIARGNTGLISRYIKNDILLPIAN